MMNPSTDPLSISESFPALARAFDQTDALAALIPEALLDWRPSDPSGAFQFSLAEIVFHLADSRLQFAQQLGGTDDSFVPMVQVVRDSVVGNSPTGARWTLQAHGGKAQMLEYLNTGRVAMQVWLEKPVSDALHVTLNSEAVFQRAFQRAQERGADTTAMQRRGPATILRVLTGATLHETGHRGTLLALLRQHGVNLPAE